MSEDAATATEVLGTSRIVAVVEAAMDACDLEGHLCALVLASGYTRLGTGPGGQSPWASRLRALLARDTVPPGPIGRSHDAALVGVRLALGAAPERASEFPAVARRELAREPLPPAACARDDIRLLLGVSAGLGAVAPALAAEVNAITRARDHGGTLRQACLDLWAEALAQGTPRLTAEVARRAMRLLEQPPFGTPELSDEDRVALFWLGTRLLDVPWEPTDDQLRCLDRIVAEGRRAAVTLALAGRSLSPLDSSLVVDALTASPLQRLARRTALEGVLAVIDRFIASQGVLAIRKRSRPPFTIADEYDLQDLFHALVVPVVPDIVEEDPASKVAGKASRLDFTSRSTCLGFELKYLRSASDVARVRDEILVDERTYQAHPYVETVVAFVLDPHRAIALGDRTAFEADMSQDVTVGGRTIHYVVCVR